MGVSENQLQVNGEGRKVRAPSGAVFKINTVEETTVETVLWRTPNGETTTLLNRQQFSVEELTTFTGWEWALYPTARTNSNGGVGRAYQ
jgi:hypothetical protein